MTTKVWFTAGYSNLYHAQNDIRRADSGSEFTLICSHTHRDFVGFAAADIVLHEPAAHGAAYLAYVRKVIKDHGVQVMLPSRKQGLLHTHAKSLAELGCQVVTVANPAMLSLINDKAALYRHLAPSGIVAIPEFYTASSFDEFESGYQTLARHHETVCFKPVTGVYGLGFRILKQSKDRIEDLLNESPRLSVADVARRAAGRQFPTLLLMQFLEGAERSVDCLAQNGNLIGGVIRRKSPVAGAAQVIEDNPALMAQVRALTTHLKLNGMFNVQFRDSGGTHYLLEINTRLSGRSYYATLAGFNIPYLAAQLFSGQKTAAELEFHIQTGLRIGNVNSPVILETTPGPAPSRSILESA